MACTTESLQERIRSMGLVTGDGHTRYPVELRREILEYSNGQRAQGRSQDEVAAELGVNGWTLKRWHQDERKPRSAKPTRFIEVSARRGRPPGKSSKPAGAASSKFDVKCPGGFEVGVPEGFEPSALRRLLSALKAA